MQINDDNSLAVNVARDVAIDRPSENEERQLAERRANVAPKDEFTKFLRSIGCEPEDCL
jgi:hypothetical protein